MSVLVAESIIAARCERKVSLLVSDGTHQCGNQTRYVVNTPYGPIHDCGQHERTH